MTGAAFGTLLVTAVYPPARGAIGDYTAYLGAALAAAGEHVEVITTTARSNRQPVASVPHPGTRGEAHTRDDRERIEDDEAGHPHRIPPVAATVSDWGPAGVRQIVRIARARCPSVVNLQYVPYLYGKRGIAPVLACLPLLLRRADVPSAVTFHELAAPWEMPPQRAAIAAVHRVQLSLLMAADATIVTTPHRAGVLRRWFPWRGARVATVPIGATTLPVQPSQPDLALLRQRLAFQPGPVLAYYGTTHPSKRPDWVLQALITARRAGIPASLLVIGPDERAFLDALGENVPQDYGLVRHAIHCTGWVADQQVPAYLALADLVLLPLVDGVSSVRTSLMAPLRQGVPVATTAGRETDRTLFTPDVVALASQNCRKAFIETVLSWCRASPEQRRALGARGQALHARHFTWAGIGTEVASVHRRVMAAR